MKTIGMIGGMSWESSTKKVQKGVTERKRGQGKGVIKEHQGKGVKSALDSC